MTTAQQKSLVRAVVGLLSAAAIPALGWSLLHVDMRYVHSDDYKLHRLSDSLHTITDQVQDSITHAQLTDVITRLRELKCGAEVRNGCR